MTKTEEIIAKTKKYCAHNYEPLPIVLTRGKGVWVKNIEAGWYMDMLSCYSAMNAGHRHKFISNAVRKQRARMSNCSRAFYTDRLAEFAELLCGICGMEKMLPMNTGAEAVETAIKIARKWGYKKKGVEFGKAEIIVCDGNFHGRTITIIGFSSEEQYKDGFGPFAPGFVSIPFGDSEALEKAVNKNTVAFLVEPVQGEAGIIVPPKDFLMESRRVCKKNNVLFIADEIQTGLGRTGKTFAFQHAPMAVPDMMILGKALGGGEEDISAVLCDDHIMEVITPGDHGSTFGGNPVACVAGIAYLTVMEKEKLSQRAAEMGKYFMDELAQIRSPNIKEVRGKGLLIGVELTEEAGGARRFCEALMHCHVLSKETHENVIRFAPPLIIEKGEVDWALEKIDYVLRGRSFNWR